MGSRFKAEGPQDRAILRQGPLVPQHPRPSLHPSSQTASNHLTNRMVQFSHRVQDLDLDVLLRKVLRYVLGKGLRPHAAAKHQDLQTDPAHT